MANSNTKEELHACDLAEDILRDAHLVRDPAGTLYLYQSGCYRPDGEAYIKRKVKEIAVTSGIAKKWNSTLALETAEFIRADAPELWPTPPVDEINVQNGLLNLNTRVLRPHSPEFLSPIQLPVIYNPHATSAAWEWFVSETFSADNLAIASQIPAWCMTPDMSIQKAIMLTGEGSNGKSAYLTGLRAFLGQENVAGVSLQKLEQDKFVAARLVGKLANISADLSNARLVSTSMLKALTGGDAIHAEKKYRDSFEFTSHAKLIFSANQPPPSDESTHAFFRRLVVVPFMRTFEEGAEGTLRRSELDAMLAAPEELSGLLNMALDALPGVQDNGLTIGPSMELALSEYRQVADPFVAWLDHTTIISPATEIKKRDLIDSYRRACIAARRPVMTDTAVGLALKRARPTVVKSEDAYRGITWKPLPIRF